MHQYQERDGEKDRKQGGKICVKDMESVGLKELIMLRRWSASCTRKKKKKKGGGCTGQDKVEEWYSKPFRRPKMMGKARGEEEEEADCRSE